MVVEYIFLRKYPDKTDNFGRLISLNMGNEIIEE